MKVAQKEPQEVLFDGHIIPAPLAITAMRDSGYKNTAYALAELIDNAQQAGASVIELLCLEERYFVRERERSRVSKIAVLDNGEGMDYSTLRIALQFGNGRYLNDRSGIGRFGMGLPNASISQAGRVEVWTWQNGPGNALFSYLDVAEIESGKMQFVSEPIHKPVPERWRNLSDDIAKKGTLVVWSKLDTHRLTWKTAKATLTHAERLVGRIYRRFIADGSVRIRLFARGESGKTILDKNAEFDDPLYLTPSPTVPPPFDKEPMFELAFNDSQSIEINGSAHEVLVRYSVATMKTVYAAGSARDRGRTKYGQHAGKTVGVSLMRAGRELLLDQGWCIGYDTRERWWGAEVEFPPELDEVFGVTNNKQGATHFSELASVEWQQLADEGEELIDVVRRLKEEGDPRGFLLPLQDSIKRSLKNLRDMIEKQGRGARSTHPTRRHDKPDDVTDTVNVGWKNLSENRPIKDEDRPRTDDDYEEIRQDLIIKEYPDRDVEALVQLIKNADLRIVFLEADFAYAYQLFNVEIKGNVTEVTFNRKHPAFRDIFGTVNTVDEDVNDLSREEVLERLLRAINAAKIVFAAWARYEREAGVDRARALEKIRYDWGQIAAAFLEPADDYTL